MGTSLSHSPGCDLQGQPYLQYLLCQAVQVLKTCIDCAIVDPHSTEGGNYIERGRVTVTQGVNGREWLRARLNLEPSAFLFPLPPFSAALVSFIVHTQHSGACPRFCMHLHGSLQLRGLSRLQRKPVPELVNKMEILLESFIKSVPTELQW